MGHTPIRNHLDIPYGLKLGDRMDPAAAHMVKTIREELAAYRDGHNLFAITLRLLDNYVALMAREDTVLPAERLPWENRDVDDWRPS